MGKWVFVGYIGAGNVGDDLMAMRFLAQLDPRVLPDVVFLGRSDERPPFLASVPVVYARASAKTTLRYIIGAKGLVLLGGTNLHDAVSDRDWPAFRRKLLMLTMAIGLCRASGGRVVQLAIGVGPLTRRDARGIAKLALRLSSTVILRDRQSFELCRALGIRRVHEARDLAFLDLRTCNSAASGAGSIMGIAPTTLANLAGATADVDDVFWIHMCERISHSVQTGVFAKVRLFAFNVSGGLSDDRSLCQSIEARLRALGIDVDVVEYDNCPEGMLRLMSECDIFVAFRYHSAIMAGLLGRRIVLVPYHKKVLDLIDQLGIKPADVLDVKQLSAQALQTEIDRIVARLEAVGRSIPDIQAIRNMMSKALIVAAEAGIPLSEGALKAV